MLRKETRRQKVDETFKDRAREVGEKNKSFSITETKNTWEKNDTAEKPERDVQNRSQDDFNLQIKVAHSVPGKTDLIQSTRYVLVNLLNFKKRE